MIEVKNLVKRYGDHVAVDHLNFTIDTGKVYGFLGPNGAGKSTTMNIMTGYLGATEGQVLIDGHDILTDPEAAKKSIGYLPELPPLYQDMTVLEYLTFVAELKNVPKEEREEAVAKAMDLAKLAEVENRLIANLSKGYRQRVGLAQAVMGFPEIIILDEPTVGLDPKQIIEIRELIRELSANHTIILSSHILAEISEVCDYILIISKGHLVASDTPANLEKTMSGASTVEILTRAPEATIRDVLKDVKHITKITCESAEDACTVGKIEVEEQQDIREAVFFAFADARCPLLSLQHSKTTLEDVFLELTESQTKEPDRETEKKSFFDKFKSRKEIPMVEDEEEEEKEGEQTDESDL